MRYLAPVRAPGGTQTANALRQPFGHSPAPKGRSIPALGNAQGPPSRSSDTQP